MQFHTNKPVKDVLATLADVASVSTAFPRYKYRITTAASGGAQKTFVEILCVDYSRSAKETMIARGFLDDLLNEYAIAA